jgi:hypothetical protein
MPSPNAGQPDPRFDTITGRWRTLGHVVAEPPIPVRGTDTYELLAGGHFLVHHVTTRVRSTLTVAADRQTMSAHWERSDDGVTCQDWMNITFTR